MLGNGVALHQLKDLFYINLNICTSNNFHTFVDKIGENMT